MLTILPKVELTKSWRYKGGDGPNIEEIRFPDSRALLSAVRLTAARLAKQGSMQVITPINSGAMGVSNLNAMLRPIINPTDSSPLVGQFYINDRVICRRNVYCDGIILAANGQIGTVAGREAGMLWVNINGNNILLDADDLRYAYAQSVHRAQGSEYDNVIFIIPDKLDQEFLTENLMLVGKTRGKNKTFVFSLNNPPPDEKLSTRH
ncbi:MAG TPA: ATP-dependent RecD-like DNA helicase [Candidatus Hydrogenedentes bacterium]|nr:ATP-dependent RecD-like DNA helicase [Candidatus Hydrogenedentota bacterium]